MGKKIVVLAALLAFLVMYLLPIGVVPGFFIGGTEQQVPAKWRPAQSGWPGRQSAPWCAAPFARR